jgi:hypothetical protein
MDLHETPGHVSARNGMKGRRSARTDAIRSELIAPCGMNCRLCRAYIRDKNPCPGCRGDDRLKPKTRVLCPIKTCERLLKAEGRYCFGCERFPCARLNHLDKRYRTKYGMSMIDNLEMIRESGIRRFISNERERWTCPACGEIVCVHESGCPCGWRLDKEESYTYYV